MSEPLAAEYQAYLLRAEEHLGELSVGSYSKYCVERWSKHIAELSIDAAAP